MTTASPFDYGNTLLGTFAFEEGELSAYDLADKVSLDVAVAGTVEFLRTGGVAQLLFSSPLDPDFDKVLIGRDGRLVANTIAGQVTLHRCHVSRYDANPGASQVTVRFLFATLGVFNSDARKLKLTYFVDTSKMDVPVGTIDVKRDDWPKKIRIDVAGYEVKASSEIDGDVLEIASGIETSRKGNTLNVRTGLLLHCIWHSDGEVDVWNDAYERAKSLRSALAALVGHVPESPPLKVSVENDGVSSDKGRAAPYRAHVGELLVCSDDEGVKDAPKKTHFLFDVSRHSNELAKIAANWVSRHRKNTDRFREAVHWAEWDARFNRTIEHGIVNFIMAMETWTRDANGRNATERLRSVMGEDVLTKLGAIGLESFNDVVEQVVWCRNFITHRGPPRNRKENVPWNYRDDKVLYFMNVSAQFLFYVHTLRLCGFDIEAWHNSAPQGEHPLVKYVKEFHSSMKYARSTKLE